MVMIECAFEGCSNTFEKDKPRGKRFCSSKCSVKSNNLKTMARNKKRRELLSNPYRKCASIGCPTILRKTNTANYCDACQRKHEDQKKKDFMDMVLNDE